MGYVLAIAVGLALIGIAIGVVLSILGAIAKSSVATKNEFIQWLGRRQLGVKAFIPEELAEKPKEKDQPRRGYRYETPAERPEYPSPLPSKDTDAADLKAYEPKAAVPRPLRSCIFTGTIERVFQRDLTEPTRTIDIDQVPELLGIESVPPYETLFTSLGSQPVYPIGPPDEPPVIPAPPTWTPWRPVFAKPSFEPPYYGSRLSFLNRFVDAAYRDEIDKATVASALREDLLARCEKRNTQVAALAEKARALYESESAKQKAAHSMQVAEQAKQKAEYDNTFMAEQAKLASRRASLSVGGEVGLLARIDATLRTMSVPHFISREGQSRLDADSGILIHEHRFPDISDIEWAKQVELKSGMTTKPANQKEKKEAAMRVYPSLCLRLACELARLDTDGIVKAVAINGWADYTEKATGKRKRAYCASLFATKEQLAALNLRALDPIEAFNALKGIFARSLELTPIAPMIRLDTNDKRFVDGKEVLGKMAGGENLASMDWEDFEHLCRQLFEKVFAASGAEVKVTQASRDQGVDAIIFDPDPLRGGKIVIQAKRYTNTVDVSAVRDLYGTVHNEGAIKGILVTTSHYGPDAYSFAKDKPLTLLDGAQLLGLLEQHGYKFRIDLAEAKRLL
jgi:restriction system protein